MKLQRDSRTVRWAYLWKRPPTSTSLCPLFWRIVLLTPLKIAIPTTAALLCVRWAYSNIYNSLIALAVIIGIFGLAAAVEIVNAFFVARRSYVPPLHERSLPYQMYRAVKGRVCPLVQIER